MNGLYLSSGEFVEFSKGAISGALTTELATRQRAGGFDVSHALGWLPDPDPVLRKRGDSVVVLEDLLADDEVTQAVQSRKLMTLNKRDFQFVPGAQSGADPEAAAVRLCADLENDLEAIDMDVLFSGILDAPYYGMTPVELTFSPDGGRLRLIQAEPKPVEWFTFDDTNRLRFCGDYFINAEPVHPYKIILARHFPTYKNPYGLRLLSRCLWPVAFKRGGIEFWTRFCEKFGQPWMLGTARQNASQMEIDTMAANLAAMVQDAVAVVPSGAKLEAVEFGGKGEAHSSYVQYWDKAINKVIKGQTLTSDMGGGHSNAAAQTHYTVLTDYAAADEQLVVTTMNNIAWAYARVNAPASVRSPVFSYREPEDYKERAELDKSLHSLGVRFTKAHFVRAYAMPEEEFTLSEETRPESQEDKSSADQSANGTPEKDQPKHKAEQAHEAKPKEKASKPAEKATPPNDSGAAFAANDLSVAEQHQEQLEQFMERVLPESVTQNEKFAQRLLDEVKAADSADDLEYRLGKLLTANQDKDSELIYQAMLNSALFGVYAASENMPDDISNNGPSQSTKAGESGNA